jgi:hypothetical protein
MSELDGPTKGTERNADVLQPPESEGSPLWIVAIMVLLLVALMVWYRFKK